MMHLKSKWLLYLLASLFSLCILALLFLLFRHASLPERVELLPLPQNAAEQNVPVPFAVLVLEADNAFAAGNLTEAMELYERALRLNSGVGFSPGSDVPVI